MSPREWRSWAACRDGVDPELFFPVADSGPVAERQVQEAKAVCGGCCVRAECLSFALGALTDGIAGGLTPAERRRHSRRLAAGGRPRVVRGSAEAGRAAIRAGGRVVEVAATFGVTVRTAERWAQDVRAARQRGAA
ncbi:WhiB family transcriptional regulator [Pseudonocardia hydrocarbonoxydans]|uniref:4Fe-4S Wbl-type domain-containing protein n=1 Tax=Pseudonocardia hydrocarbonoxydans TaxID=76726 RepID=A0A4Y3WIC1_9PSEU|nr:WhiB family transcriptional regulator [Pseudonocardia hydrocarbonoxydans]GEC18702.1 hypothetical protein PHY01_09850 [Pseudonocardia hydrocarbonoxydans]